jgi:hypothetical protein
MNQTIRNQLPYRYEAARDALSEASRQDAKQPLQ